MPIDGRHQGQQRGSEPLTLTEVSFDFPLADLRRIAKFLINCADEAESGEWRSEHQHIADGWHDDHPDSDIIVFHPFPDPPRFFLGE